MQPEDQVAERRPDGGSPFARISRFIRREGKRVAVGIVGGVVVIAGVVLMPLPGPGMLVVLAGLAILATQFRWAQDVLDRARERARDALDRLRGGSDDEDGDDGGAIPDPSASSHLDRGAVGGRSDVA